MLLDYVVRKSLDWNELAHDCPAASLDTQELEDIFPTEPGEMLLTRQLSA